MKVDIDFRKKARIEMLPLIDIVFLLLVFFIYAMLSMTVHRGLRVVLPASATAKIEKQIVLSVTIRADGDIFLDKTRVALEELAHTLKQKAKEEKETGVLLFADASTTYQELFRILDQIRMAGLTKISLQAELDG